MNKENNMTVGYVDPSKVIHSSYPNGVSIIEGIIKISSFTDDFLDCFSEENLINFLWSL